MFTSIPYHLFIPNAIQTNSLLSKIVDITDEYEEKATKSLWHLLPHTIMKMAGLSELIFQSVKIRSNLSHFQDKEYLSINKHIEKTFSKFFSSAGHQSGYINELKKNINQNSELNETVKKTAIKMLETGSLNLNNSKNINKHIKDEINFLCNSYIELRGLICEASFASYFGTFYKRVKKQRVKVKNIQKVNKTLFDSLSDTIDKLLKDKFPKLFNSLERNQSLEKYINLATISKFLLHEYYSFAGILVGGNLALIENTKDMPKKNEVLKYILNIMKLLGHLSLLNVYCEYILVNSLSPSSERWFNSEKRTVNDKVFDTVTPEGKKTLIAGLQNNNNLHGDEFIQIEGIVSDLRNITDPRPPKYSSIFKISNYDTNEFMEIRAHMFNLKANGLRNGSYCQVNGYLKKNARWAQNKWSMDIDRVSLTQQRKQSWYDDITYRMRDYYYLFKDEMNMWFTPVL